jgi:hypothetical protein
MTKEVRLGGTPKPARETRALPGDSLVDLVELVYPFGLTDLNVARF